VLINLLLTLEVDMGHVTNGTNIIDPFDFDVFFILKTCKLKLLRGLKKNHFLTTYDLQM
jgi:hypothetical protein